MVEWSDDWDSCAEEAEALAAEAERREVDESLFTYVGDMDLFVEATPSLSYEEHIVWAVLLHALECIKVGYISEHLDDVAQAILDWEWLFSDDKDFAPISVKSIEWWTGMNLQQVRAMVLNSNDFPDDISELETRYFILERIERKEGKARKRVRMNTLNLDEM